MWDFFIAIRLHILYASLLTHPSAIPIVHHYVHCGRVLELLLYDPRIQCVVRAHFNSILSQGPAAGSLTIRVCVCIIVCIVIETIRNQRRSMTLPDERYRALKWAEQFMQDLCDPSKTPRVPKSVRAQARSVLRHYPGEYYLEEMARRAPDIIAPKMEDLHKFVLRGTQQDN